MELGLPWTEKYRPHKLKDVEGQREIVKRLEAYAKTGDLPHMMFAGPAGVGKTTCSIALARELFGENYKANFLELNASD
ncbi:MAG TPA: DEAD/DEAH box helicase family protein, partial [archaeon]|nr:DEAD/DEAH box helicase family protein [archaeon]